MKNTLILLALFAGFNLSAQTIEWNKPNEPKVIQPKSPAYEAAMKETQVGSATFYADYLAGHRTAHGEIYRPTELTASHAVLPIGTIIRVTRTDNGKTVDARINDSGGICNGCIVVLSRAAADQIGLTIDGRTRVTVKRTGFSNWNPRPQRVTSQVTARGDYQQPSAYGQRATTENVPSPTTYGNRQIPAPPVYRKAPVQAPVTYRTTQIGVQTQQRVISNNRIGENQPDFGDAYGNPEPKSYNNPIPSQQRDPNAYRPATLTEKSGAVIIAPPVRRQFDQSSATVRPAVIEREVATNTSAYQVYSQPAPTTYARRQVAVPTPAEVAPVSEVQVATNNVSQGYAVQLASYGNVENAMRQVRALQARGVDNIYLASVPRTDGSTLNRVLVGPFPDMATAQSNADGLQANKKINGIVVKLR
jgi:rare lipoprotein A